MADLVACWPWVGRSAIQILLLTLSTPNIKKRITNAKIGKQVFMFHHTVTHDNKYPSLTIKEWK
jgi:hypothetical protein